MNEIATLGPAQRWSEIQKDEIVFWDKELSGQGGWADEVRRRQSDMPLHEDLAVLIDAPLGARVKILDVGAGPLTSVGTIWSGRTVFVTAIDPEAAEYDRLLAKYGIIPPCRTAFGDAENLSRFVQSSAFDLVHARNCIDHSRDVLMAVSEMVQAVKPGRYVYLNHHVREGRNERYSMNHQWDMFPRRGRFYVERPGMRAVDVGETTLKGIAEVSVGPSPDGDGWFVAKIRRKI